jgi:hypothetical protein
MKNILNRLLTLFFFVLVFQVSAQPDTTRSKWRTGHSIYGSVGLLSNSSMKAIGNELEAVAVKPFGQLMTNVILGMRREDDRKFYESRLLFFKAPVEKQDNPGKYAVLNGVAIGMDFGPKLVSNDRWNVQIPIGYDLALYRMRIKSDHEVDLVDVVQNIAPYQPVKIHTANVIVNAGLGVDYKMDFLPTLHEKVYLSSKVSYQLPVFTKSKWRGEDVTVRNISSLKSNQLYFQLGLIFFPRKGRVHSAW